jgi:hypothetical protein
MKPGCIILNRRQKGAGQEEVPTGHARTLVYRWRKAVEVNGDFVEK